MKNNYLVMGLISSYPLHYIKPFFTSLHKSGYREDVVMFVQNIDKDTEDFIMPFCTEIIKYNEIWPYLDDPSLVEFIPKCNQQLTPHCLRYLLYNAFLKARGMHYTLALIADVRDVYFQKNPFGFPYKEGLSVFMENVSMTIGSQMHNRYWIEKGFGQKVLEQLFDKPISCSGVTLGDAKTMVDYLDKMIYHINIIENVPGLDQGIHNYLIHNNSLPYLTIYPDDAGSVSTISLFKPKEAVKIKNRNVIGLSGQIINIVHQYDRSDRLLLAWNPRYYFEYKFNLLKGQIYPFWKWLKARFM